MTDGAPDLEPDFEVKERAMDEAPVGIAISDPHREDNPLIYVNERFEAVTGYPASEVVGRNCRFLQGDDTDEAAVAEMREAIEDREPATVEVLNYRKDGDSFWNEVTIAPLFDDDGTLTHFVGFQADVTRRKEAERALAAERERLDVVLDRVVGLLSAVTEPILTATARSSLETGICRELADRPEYRSAWTGRLDPATETVTITASAGEAPSTEESIPETGDHPAAMAFHEGSVQLGPADDPDGRCVAVPVTHREEVLGVLVLRLDPEATVDDRERTVFTALGRTIGAAASVLESRRILAADEYVDVELQLTDPEVLPVGLSRALDCRVEYVGAGRSDPEQTLYFEVSGAGPESVRTALADVAVLEDVTVLAGDEEECRLAVTVDGDDLVGHLAERGVETRSFVAEDGRATLSLSLPAPADVRGLFDRVAERHPGTELLSTTSRDRRPQTRGEFLDDVADRLTGRQYTALRTAFAGGYFDRPRTVSGDELADAMDVTRSTFHQHLRAAERKLLEAFFDE